MPAKNSLSNRKQRTVRHAEKKKYSENIEINKKSERKEQDTKQRQTATHDFSKIHFNISRIIILFEKQLGILVKTVMKTRVPLKAGNLLSS